MQLLLDTHAFLWWMEGSPLLGTSMRTAIADRENTVYLSMASVWELTIKQALGKLRFPADPEAVLDAAGFRALPITFAHLRELAALPQLHRDPFDRLLIAQSRTEGLTIITRDSRFAPYGVGIIW